MRKARARSTWRGSRRSSARIFSADAQSRATRSRISGCVMRSAASRMPSTRSCAAAMTWAAPAVGALGQGGALGAGQERRRRRQRAERRVAEHQGAELRAHEKGLEDRDALREDGDGQRDQPASTPRRPMAPTSGEQVDEPRDDPLGAASADADVEEAEPVETRDEGPQDPQGVAPPPVAAAPLQRLTAERVDRRRGILGTQLLHVAHDGGRVPVLALAVAVDPDPAAAGLAESSERHAPAPSLSSTRIARRRATDTAGGLRPHA